MSRYTSDIVKQWVCDKVFNKNKASKDVLTAFQECALHKAFLLITRDKPMKKDEKWQMLSILSVEQSENFFSHNFEGVEGSFLVQRFIHSFRSQGWRWQVDCHLEKREWVEASTGRRAGNAWWASSMPASGLLKGYLCGWSFWRNIALAREAS